MSNTQQQQMYGCEHGPRSLIFLNINSEKLKARFTANLPQKSEKAPAEASGDLDPDPRAAVN